MGLFRIENKLENAFSNFEWHWIFEKFNIEINIKNVLKIEYES